MSQPIVLHGNSLDVLKDLPDNSIDSVVTDPPYGLSFMGKRWDYDVPSAEIWREVLRVLKPGGHLLSFGGTRTYHRMVVNIEDAGFEIRDQIQWLYGSGFPKSHNIKEGPFKGWGTALKPANEPIVLARKPLDGTVAQNVETWGVGGLNIYASRIGTDDVIPSVTNQNIKGAAFKSDNSSKDRDTTCVQNTLGRWPANIILDEEAAKALDAQSGILKSGARNTSQKSGFQSDYVGGKAATFSNACKASVGGASRFFYVAKASKSERNTGLEGMPEKSSPKFDGGDFERGNGNNAKEQKAQNFHPTVKPIRLMEYLIKLITPPGGIVLDPFTGSGTTGVAATKLGFGFIGIELNAEYVEIAEKRINNVKVTNVEEQ